MRKKINSIRFFLIDILSALTLVVCGVTAIWGNKTKVEESILIGIGVIFAYLAYRLTIKTSPLNFIESFKEYCRECADSLKMATNDSQISTIQTPIKVDVTNDPDYKTYITTTADVIIAQSTKNNGHKVSLYRRLVVINDKNRPTEISNEKEKLIELVDIIYYKLEYSNHWQPTLKNIEIAIVEANDINKSPYANIDILIVAECILKLCFPKYLPDKQEFIWGTSLNIRKNGLLEDYSIHCHHFKEIFDEVWDKCKKTHRVINLGEFYNPNEKKISKTKTLNAIDNLFTSL